MPRRNVRGTVAVHSPPGPTEQVHPPIDHGFGPSTTPHGERPTGIVAITRNSDASMTLTLLEGPLAVYKWRASEESAMPQGRVPAVISVRRRG